MKDNVNLNPPSTLMADYVCKNVLVAPSFGITDERGRELYGMIDKEKLCDAYKLADRTDSDSVIPLIEIVYCTSDFIAALAGHITVTPKEAVFLAVLLTDVRANFLREVPKWIHSFLADYNKVYYNKYRVDGQPTWEEALVISAKDKMGADV